ncbi:MAG: M16 family metallopeptidase [Acidimicrobiales bacterium]
MPRPKLVLERFTLANGLRVVVNVDRSSPTVGIAVRCDVGFRSEREGRTGFAHLFEHLMFQETLNLDRGVADRLIEGNGGNLNGSTHPDSTVYISQLPSSAFELGLFLEADRMRGSRLTHESLRNQIDVVKEEINVNVHNRPYGGFPWIDLPPVMFDTFNNAHNGYGSFVDLEEATVEDAADFFDRYYAPANAVLAVTGDVRDVEALVERHFGSIPARPVAAAPDLAEPLLTAERRASRVDPLAPMPAVAIGYRMPDPQTDEFWAAVVLGDVLAGGEASRLYQRMVKRDRVAVEVATTVGAFGDPWEMRDPTMLQFLAWHPGVALDTVLERVDEEIALAARGVSEEEVERVVTSIVSDWLRQLDNVLERAMAIGQIEQQRGRAELVNELPQMLGAIGAAEVTAAAARWLAVPGRAVLEVVAGSVAGS